MGSRLFPKRMGEDTVNEGLPCMGVGGVGCVGWWGAGLPGKGGDGGGACGACPFWDPWAFIMP